ncbi:hypothetical protein niasHT_001059 [Heterodera trifolii]
MGKFGGLNITPYPVGIDFSKTGDILVGDSHGNHFHIVVFSSAGQPLVHYRCHLQKVSRCTGLKIAADGRIITLSRQSSSRLYSHLGNSDGVLGTFQMIRNRTVPEPFEQILALKVQGNYEAHIATH